MNILMVNKFLYPNGGSESYIFRLGDYLKTLGHEVQYFGMEHKERCVGNNINSYTSYMDFHGGSLPAKLSYPLKTIYSSEARKKIRLVLDDFQPDVVHLNNFTYQLTPSILLEIQKWKKQTRHKCRIIFTAHDSNLVCPNHMMNRPSTKQNCQKCLGGHFIYCMKYKCIHNSTLKSIIGMLNGYFWKMRGVYQYIDSVICCSEFMKQIIDTDPHLAGKTVTLHNFISKTTWKNTQKKNYVLYFGRFSEEKGISTLCNVCKELPDIPFVFAGFGPLAETVNAVPNIQNVGFQQGIHLEKLIREALFSICPSECYENCPFSVMESQAYGTPVIAANIGGIPELIENGKTGELFESGNSNDLKQHIQKLWNTPELTAFYSQNCKNSHYDTIVEYTDKLLNFYM